MTYSLFESVLQTALPLLDPKLCFPHPGLTPSFFVGWEKLDSAVSPNLSSTFHRLVSSVAFSGPSVPLLFTFCVPAPVLCKLLRFLSPALTSASSWAQTLPGRNEGVYSCVAPPAGSSGTLLRWCAVTSLPPQPLEASASGCFVPTCPGPGKVSLH